MTIVLYLMGEGHAAMRDESGETLTLLQHGNFELTTSWWIIPGTVSFDD